MKLLLVKSKSDIGVWLIIINSIIGSLCVAFSLLAGVEIGVIIGMVSLMFSFVFYLIGSDIVQKTNTYSIDDYEFIDMKNFCLVVFCDNIRKNHLIATFFTKHAYEAIEVKTPFTIKVNFNYFSSFKKPDNITAIIGEEHVHTTSLKTWNPII